MQPREMTRLASPDDWPSKRLGESGLKIDASTLVGEIGDNKLRPADLYDDTVTDLVIMLEFQHPYRGEPTIILYRRSEALLERSVEALAEGHRDEAPARRAPRVQNRLDEFPAGDSESTANTSVSAVVPGQKLMFLQVNKIRPQFRLVMRGNEWIIAR